MYLRTVKVPSSSGKVNEYVRIVESYRQGGKVKQRLIADLGRKDVLAGLLPRLRRVLGDQQELEQAAGPGDSAEVLEALNWGPMLVVRALAEQIALMRVLDGALGLPREAGEAAPADRALVLLANRLSEPRSEHGLAQWLATDLACDRQGRRFAPCWKKRGRVKVAWEQLDAWLWDAGWSAKRTWRPCGGRGTVIWWG